MQRWPSALFFALALAYVVPIWSVRHLPTSDGPTHLYNSWVLHELIAGDTGAISRFYAVDWRPHPNWIGHAALALLMIAAPPAIAEKILVTAIVLLFLAGLWIYSGKSIYALFAFPFAYHQFLQLGFYNFSIGVALYFLILAIWWRQRDRPDARTITGIALLLILCYFAHPLPTFLAIGSIGFLWLMTLRGRPFLHHARHLAAFVPVLALLIWFEKLRGTGMALNRTPLTERLDLLARIDALHTFDAWQTGLGVALLILLIALGVVTRVLDRRRSETDSFLALTGVFVILYLIAPQSAAGGMGIPQRILIFIYLLPLPWFTLELPGRARFAAIFLLTAIAVINLGYLIDRYRYTDRFITEFLSSLGSVPRDTTLLPLISQRWPPGLVVPVYSHLTGYTAIERRLVDLGNYEPSTGYFPIRYRPEVDPINMYPIERTPGDVDVEQFAGRAQCIFTWKMGRDTPTETRIEQRYSLVSSHAGGRLYCNLERRNPPQSKPWSILLPIAGTVGDAVEWHVRQNVRNSGHTRVHFAVNPCEDRCEFDLDPGEQVPLASRDGEMPYLLVSPAAGSEKELVFSTLVSHHDDPIAAIPAIPQSAFQHRKILIANIPFGGTKLNLRAWILGETSRSILIRIRSRDGRLLAEKVERVAAMGFYTNANLTAAFPQIPVNQSVDVEIDAQSDEMRIWAFITATTFDDRSVKLHLPRPADRRPG